MTALFALFVATGQDSTFVPLDTTTVGGPANEAEYTIESTVFEPLPLVEDDFVPTNEADSAFWIPGYDQYGSFNTKVIFPALPKKNAVDSLILAYEACDHVHPICGQRTSGYGMRRGRFHHGVDIDLETGDLVRNLFSGKVRISHYSRSFGNVVVVRHDNGLETLYAHLSHRLVEVGDMIDAGTVLGLGGNTGRSSGSHLHLEVRYLGRSIDPERILDIREGELKTDVYHLNEVKRPSPIRSNTHKVKRGENLSVIARKHGTTVDALCRLNAMSRKSTLRVGRVLLLK